MSFFLRDINDKAFDKYTLTSCGRFAALQLDSLNLPSS